MSAITLLASSSLSIESADLNPEMNSIRIILSSESAFFNVLKTYIVEQFHDVFQESRRQTHLESKLSI